MRQSLLTNSGSLLSRLISAARCTGLAGVMLACLSAVSLAENPEASQVEFAPSAEIPMEIIKGAKPATIEDAQFAGAEKAVGTLAPPEPGSVGDAREEIESEKLDLGALVVGYESSAVTPSGGETLTAELVSAFKAPMSATDERWLLPSLSLCFDFLPLSFFFFLLSVAIGS